MPTRYSIKDLEKISGIKAHTLRIWEQRYNILRPRRTPTNIRYYSSEDLKRILNISVLNGNGYRISSIAKLSDADVVKEVEKILSTYRSEDVQVDNLILCLMDLDEERFTQVVSNCIAKFGIENTYEKVIFPFLREIGHKWQLGIISPAQEHYMSNLIRQKIIVAIDRLSDLSNPRAKTILFFLPGDELHELGLLYAHYLSRLKGHRCVYLGQCVPVEDLLQIAEATKPDLAVTVLTSPIPAEELADLFLRMQNLLPGCGFLVSGRVLLQDHLDMQLPGNPFRLFQDFSEYKVLLNEATA